MADGPFRDDHEAALARAEALAEENERLRAQLERERRREVPEQPGDAPVVSPNEDAKLAVGIVIVLVVLGGLFGLATMIASRRERNERSLDESTERVLRQFEQQSAAAWRQQIEDYHLRGCIRNELDRVARPDDEGPLMDVASITADDCIRDFDREQDDARLSSDAKERLAAWTAAWREIEALETAAPSKATTTARAAATARRDAAARALREVLTELPDTSSGSAR